MFGKRSADDQAFIDHYEFCIDYGIFLPESESERYFEIINRRKEKKKRERTDERSACVS